MRSKVAARILNETPEDVKIFTSWYADIVVRVHEIMREKKITQKSLAEKMDKKPSEISKWLSGEHNFTLRSLAKLEAELGVPILTVAGGDEDKRAATRQFLYTVHRKSDKVSAAFNRPEGMSDEPDDLQTTA
ncbi:MAG: helix-turn-helix transcriptional regulator [Bacteroidia bacterium]|jgi:transcriptional regulator with XRE-family HTH domain|nr:helix-turn-helix transcriptional regulator [Bacteroidia bacterium]